MPRRPLSTVHDFETRFVAPKWWTNIRSLVECNPPDGGRNPRIGWRRDGPSRRPDNEIASRKIRRAAWRVSDAGLNTPSSEFKCSELVQLTLDQCLLEHTPEVAMRIDQASISARSPFLSLTSEDVAERELARLESILSGQSDAASSHRTAIPRKVAVHPKNNAAAFGLIGSLGTVGTLFFALTVPSLSIATRDGIARPDVSLPQTAPSFSTAADTLPYVQSGRSTAIAETTPASGTFAQAPPPIKSKTRPPTKSLGSAMAATTQRVRQVRRVVSKGTLGEATAWPIGARQKLLAGTMPRPRTSATEDRRISLRQRQCLGWQICRLPREIREYESNKPRGPRQFVAPRIAPRRLPRFG